MKIATLAQSPVFGGRVKSVDDTAAKAVNGVRQIVRLDDAVAVVADHMGAAKKGLEALVIEWDDGPHAKLNTDEIVGALEKATLNAGVVAQNIGDRDKAMASAITFLAHAGREALQRPRSLRSRLPASPIRPMAEAAGGQGRGYKHLIGAAWAGDYGVTAGGYLHHIRRRRTGAELVSPKNKYDWRAGLHR